jgi:hypothetical protein
VALQGERFSTRGLIYGPSLGVDSGVEIEEVIEQMLDVIPSHEKRGTVEATLHGVSLEEKRRSIWENYDLRYGIICTAPVNRSR